MLRTVAFLLVSILSANVFCSADRVYSVGVVPQFEARKLHDIWQPILDRLESATGYRFKLSGSPSIPDFEKEFGHRNFDFAYMNPYHLVIANEQAGYLPLVRDHGRELFGVLVVRSDSPVEGPADLEGQVVAYPSPNALGAALQMRQELHDDFGVTTVPRYVNTHDSVYLNVLLGKVAAGGGVQKTFNRQPARYREELRIIHTTYKVAPHPIVVSPDVPANVRDAVRQALLELAATPEGRALFARIPMRKAGVSDMSDYAPLLNMGLERFYVPPGGD